MRSPSPPTASSRSGSSTAGLVDGHLAAVPLAVLFAAGDEGRVPAILVTVVAIVVSALALRAAAVLVTRRWLAPLGAVLVVAGCALLAVTPRGAITVPIAAVLGAGAGIAMRERPTRGRTGVVVGLGAACAEAALVAAVGGRIAALTFVALLGCVAAAVNLVTDRQVVAARRLGKDGIAFVTVASVLAGGLVLWVAGNDPTVQWFGGITTHGPRAGNQVAITFDDGPDDPYSLQVADILDRHGVKGTFFEVGKAIDARPDIARALYADGQLLGDHSYHHDYWRWLDPRYPELDRTQAAFARNLGTCPTFFRPPHGQRTPFMLAHVRSHDMHPVTWDVSAQDWSDHDGDRVAARIVERAQPGSIILLHDGLDGNVHADRSVLLTALPKIIEGLEAKGLHPVRLDELLGLPGYQSC